MIKLPLIVKNSTPTAFLALIGLQLVGECLHTILRLPGPVIGMCLLTALLVGKRNYMDGARGDIPAAIEVLASSLIADMGLLFVPAGVGIMVEADLLRGEWLPIGMGIVGSTLLSLLVTGLVMHRFCHEGQEHRLPPTMSANAKKDPA